MALPGSKGAAKAIGMTERNPINSEIFDAGMKGMG
jgi:hypothetical protein